VRFRHRGRTEIAPTLLARADEVIE